MLALDLDQTGNRERPGAVEALADFLAEGVEDGTDLGPS